VPDAIVTLGAVLAMLGVALWIAHRDDRRRQARLDRTIRDRYRRG
jgi:hypothetical protein